MGRAQAHGPTIRRLEPDAPASAGANVGAFDGHVEAFGNTAMMTAYPGPMTGALSLGWRLALLPQSVGKAHGLCLHQDEVRLPIIANDRPGLLATLAHKLLIQKIELHNAKIITLGNRAEDTFLISAKKGQKLDVMRIKMLREALTAEI